MPVPHILANLWLAKDNGITWQDFFGRVYPVMDNEGITSQCGPLVEFFQQASLDAVSSLSDMTRPVAPPRNTVLMKDRLEALRHLFPQLQDNATAHQHGLIAKGLGLIAHQQQQHYEELREDKARAEAGSIKQMFGEAAFPRLLRMLGVRNETELVSKCPIYQSMAKASKGERMSRLQSAIDEVVRKRDIRSLHVRMTPGLFSLFRGLE